MTSSTVFPNRTLRLSYWNIEKRVVDSERLSLETHLRQLGEVKITPVDGLDAPGAMPCDLLIVAAQILASQDFPTWLTGLSQRIQRQGHIWTPALILADIPFAVLRGILPVAVRDNWYFDILAPQHIESLPIRVANLLRIHDHLHELRRYGDVVDDLGKRASALEAELKRLRPQGA
jgi:hypothetical protein